MNKPWLHRFIAWLMLVIAGASCHTDKKATDEMAWSFIGIGGGGAMFHPAISPHNPSRVMVACDMTGSYRSENGGESWKMFNLHGPVDFFVYDPQDSNVVYANSIGLFKSVDQGKSWRLFYPALTEIIGVVSKGDHAEERLVTTDSTVRRVTAFAIDPQNSNRLYAAMNIKESPGFYSSTDGGTHWKKELSTNEKVKNIFIVPSSPADNRTILLTTAKGLWSKKDHQWNFNPSPRGISLINSFAGGFDKSMDRFIIYAISGTSYFNTQPDSLGIFYTDDDGVTWKNVQGGILSYQNGNDSAPEWRAIATSAENPSAVYVSFNNLSIHRDTISFGVAKSMDFGNSWHLVWQDKVTHSKQFPSSNFYDAWLNKRFGPTWGENPFALAVHAKNPDICYATDFGRTVRTKDAGETWEEVYSKRIGNGWTTRGLEVTTSYALIVNPFDTKHYFIANTDIGLVTSLDGGQSWKSATENSGVPSHWENSTYWLTFDPNVKGRAWAAMSGTHDLPRPKMWRNRGTAHFKGGILTSDDAGITWRPLTLQAGEAAYTHIVIDTNSAVNNRTLYACAFGKGVYKSIDNGKSWELKNNGIETSEPLAWRLTHSPNGILYLIVSRRSEDGSIGTIDDGYLYRSSDGADSWHKVDLPDGVNGPTSLAVDPEQPNKIILTAWGRKTPGYFTPDSGGGIYLSVDEGKSWKAVLTSDQHIHDITFDSRNKTYYSCGFNGSAYRSVDGAVSWKRIPGYNFKWGKRVDFDPDDPDGIFVITFGGGVWKGRSHGDLHVNEDVVPRLERF